MFKSELLKKHALARATLVLDENLFSLKPELEKRNFKVITVPSGMADDTIKQQILSHRIFVTNNPEDFKYDVPVLEFSVIDTTRAPKDPITLASLISKAFVDYGLKSKGQFILSLHGSGKHRLQVAK